MLVSVGMEGATGAVHPDDIRPGRSEYERNRALIEAEASAAIRGVRVHAPDAEVLVADAHARFRNLLPDQLGRSARLLRGERRADGMMAGLAADVAAVLYIGYHGKAGPLDRCWPTRSPAGSSPTPGATGNFSVSSASTPRSPHTTVYRRCWSAGTTPWRSKRSRWHRASAAWWSSTRWAPVRRHRSIRTRPATGSSARCLWHWLAGVRSGSCAWTDVHLEVRVHRPHMTEHALLVPGMERVEGCTLRYTASDLPTAYRVIELIAVRGAA